MPEHVHLLVNEPDRGTLAQAVQSLKQGVARRLALRAAESFWEAITISTSGATTSLWRSCAIFIGIQ
jgi:REP element-mobilizing transposase RayT